MPAVALQNQKVETLRKKYVAMIKSVAAPQAIKQQMLAKAATMTKEQLIAELKGVSPQAKVQAKAQAKAQSQKRTSAKAQSRKSQKGARGTRKSRTRATKGGARRLVKIPKTLRSRVGKLVRAIKAGKIAVRQGKDTPSVFPLQDARDRYAAFAALYEDVRVTRKSRKTRKSVKVVYQQIQGQKFPYMIKKARRIPARVGVIPGTKATPFNQLDETEQRKVVSFLNTEKAKKLRQKGAPREVSFQNLTAKKGAANR